MALVQEKREVSDFDEIQIELSGEATITQGETESLVIEADPEVLSRLKSEVRAGRLELGLRNWYDVLFMIGHPTIRYTITVKKLRGVFISGSGKIATGPIETDRLRLKVSGSGEFHLSELQTKDLEVEFSGSGKAEVKGTADRLDLDISGSGELRAEDLESKDTRVRISGSGSARVTAREHLSVVISGSGEVRFRGQPTIEHRISGSGSIKAL